MKIGWGSSEINEMSHTDIMMRISSSDKCLSNEHCDHKTEPNQINHLSRSSSASDMLLRSKQLLQVLAFESWFLHLVSKGLESNVHSVYLKHLLSPMYSGWFSSECCSFEMRLSELFSIHLFMVIFRTLESNDSSKVRRYTPNIFRAFWARASLEPN